MLYPNSRLCFYYLLSIVLLSTGVNRCVAENASPLPVDDKNASQEELQQPKIVCYGDSITKRAYPDILATLVNAEVVRSAVAGHSTGQAMPRLKSEVLANSPDVVVILFGTNDIRVDNDRVHVPRDKFRANLTKMVTECQKAGAKVVLCTLPPINEKVYFTRHDEKVYQENGGLTSLINDYRTITKEVAAINNASLVDLNGLLADESEFLGKDGIHPSEMGNAILANHVAAAVRPLLKSLKAPEAEDVTDVIVYGGTSAGVVAAVQVARMKKSVKLIVTHSHIGGLTSGALGATDIGNKDVIGGISREFYQRVAKHYADDSNWRHETREEFFEQRSTRTKMEDVIKPGGAMWTFEPHVAERIFRDLLREAGVTVVMKQKIIGVNKQQGEVVSITTDAGETHSGRMFVDASYEGDLLAKAGVSYTVGREANAKYGETLNGIRAKTPKNQIYGSVDPYNEPGNPESGLIPLIQEGDGGTPGDGDHRVQAYNFRLCFTDVAENRLKVKPPENYDPKQYELAARRAEKIVERGGTPLLKNFCNPVWMPNRKTDINNSQGISTDFIGANYKYPDSNYQDREAIQKAHYDYVRGFWYFMSNNKRVPQGLRDQFLKFGPCKDEFLETAGWSPQLYVREARRMVADYVMTEKNCRREELVKDSVGMAAYGMDSHNCQRIVKNGAARNEGDVQVHDLKPYPVSLRSIVPVKSECENLVVPVCVSASHIAFGSIRMEPVFMVLGQSAAVVACMAIDEGVAVQDLNYKQIKQVLVAEGQVLKRPIK